MADPKIIVAIDSFKPADALGLLDQLNPELCRVKIGSVAFNALGKTFSSWLISAGIKFF